MVNNMVTRAHVCTRIYRCTYTFTRQMHMYVLTHTDAHTHAHTRMHTQTHKSHIHVQNVMHIHTYGH